jgi:hypothetical protein
MQYFFPFHGSSGYTNMPEYYVYMYTEDLVPYVVCELYGCTSIGWGRELYSS